MTWLRDYHIFEMTGNCFYCGRKVHKNNTPNNRPTRDHKMPVCRGGINLHANLVTACSRCNGDKSALTTEEYRAFHVMARNFYNLRLNNHIRIMDIRFAGEVRAC